MTFFIYYYRLVILSSIIMPIGNRDISDRIQQVRGKLKKSEFADALGIPRPNLSRYEKGRTPPADVLQKIADYGGVTVKWLLTGKEGEKDLGKPLLPDQPSVAPGPGRPCEVQEFLLAEVLRAVEEYMKKYKLSYPLGYRARLITLLYNHCVRKLESLTESLVVKFDEYDED
jgi:transcriptional regulator with XRE-family HTH domain